MTINITERLAFILGIIPEGRIEEALGTIRLARHVYSKSSDVLHGRSSMMSVPNVVITEWRQVVDRLDEILGLSATGT